MMKEPAYAASRLHQSTGDWYTHAASFAFFSAAVFSTTEGAADASVGRHVDTYILHPPPRERSINRANSSCDILRMDALDVREMFQEGAKQAFGEHSDLTFYSFPILYNDLTWGKVQVFDA